MNSKFIIIALIILSQYTDLIFDIVGQTSKLGLDNYLNKNSSFGIAYTHICNNQEKAGIANFNARRSAEQPIYSEASTQKTLDIASQNHLANFNMQPSFKKKSQFSADLNAGYFGKIINNSLNTSTLIQDINSEKLVPALLNETSTGIEIKTFKVDYCLPISNILKFETGIK